MSDITMCKGTNCPHKENCYRYVAKANDCWQAFFVKVPYDPYAEDCEYYWSNGYEQ
jgi:hypothetical protein